MKKILTMCMIMGLGSILSAQTSLSGKVSGTLKAASSPYLVKSSIEVEKGKTLLVEPGVELYFEGAYNLDVYGSIQAKGTTSAPILFTAQDTTTGWKGVRIFKEQQGADSNIFEHCSFTYAWQITPDVWRDFGAMLLDTVSNVRISNCRFSHNTAFVSGCIRGFLSKFILNDCVFEYNQALDLGTTPPSNTTGPGTSCVGGAFCEVIIQNCIFRRNRSQAPNYTDKDEKPRAGGVVGFNGNKVKILNCRFEDNFADAGYILIYGSSYQGNLKLDSFTMERCLFKGNIIRDNYIVSLDGSYGDYARFFVKDCDFIENKCLTEAMGRVLFCFNRNGSANNMIIDRCRLINNETYNGIMILAGTKLTLSNSEIYGQKGKAIEVRETGLSNMVNCIVANNWVGMEVAFNAEFDVVSSVIAYNGRLDTTLPYPQYKDILPFHYSNGIYLTNRSKVNLYNSIVAHNKASDGSISNVTGTTRVLFPGKLSNCILEGGQDSTFLIGFDTVLVKLDSVPFSEMIGVNTGTPVFVKPPKGIGVDYVDTTADFHLKETCDTSWVYNKGQNVVLGLPFNLWPSGDDFAGNPRIKGGIMDIGIYEIKGPKGYTALESNWKDTTLCSNNLAIFNPDINGFEVSYQWQKSANKASWVDLNKDAYNDSKLINPVEGYYRVITSQSECGVIDTMGPVKLSVIQAPQPYLGDDTTISVTDSIWLTPGDFEHYAWTIPGGDTSHALLRARYYPNANEKLVWVEVTAKSGCKARDSIIVGFKPLGVDGINLKQGVKVYPNPATDMLHIDLGDLQTVNSTCSLYGPAGSLLRQCKVSNHTVEPIQLDISALPTGLYHIVVQTETEKQSATILINRP